MQAWHALALALAVCLSACALPSAQERGLRVEAVAAAQGWSPLTLKARDFDLRAFAPTHRAALRRLHVYIEGDGLAWLDRHTPSFSPTPLDPLALRLAMADASGSAVYLARPCQSMQGPGFRHCHPRHWTSHRFAPELVEAMDQALDQLVTAFGTKELVLIGYSGGGAMAALLAARRSDVAGLVTVAGVLDTPTWAAETHTDELTGSLNPAAFAQRLRDLPQWHFAGERDTVVPARVLDAFLAAQGNAKGLPPTTQRRDLPGFDHSCCWAQAWPGLSRTITPAPLRARAPGWPGNG